MLVGWPVASTLGGRLIPRVGFRPLVRLGLGITVVAALLLALYGERGGLSRLQLVSALFGVGMGFANTALLIAVQTSVSWGERGIATASTMFFRTIGGALAISVMGGVLNASLTRDGSISEETASQVLTAEGMRHLDPALLDRVSGALTVGIGQIFWLVVGIAAVAFVISLWFPEVIVNPGGEAGGHPQAPGQAGAPAPPPEPAAMGH
jgi:MFS family permease